MAKVLCSQSGTKTEPETETGTKTGTGADNGEWWMVNGKWQMVWADGWTGIGFAFWIWNANSREIDIQIYLRREILDV